MKKCLIAFGLLSLIFVSKIYGVWDITTPAGSEAKSLGDDRIREFKTDVQTSLQFEGDFPGPDTANPRFIYTPSTGTTALRPSGSTNTAVGMLFINRSSGCIEMYMGSGNWQCIGVLASSTVFASNLASDVAGAGLGGEGAVPLRVNVDSNTFTITNDTVTIISNSIGSSQIADNVNFSSITWGGFGMLPILQVKYSTTDAVINITSSAFANSASLVSITPKIATSKIFVYAAGTGLQNAGDSGTFTLARDGNNLGPANGLAAVNSGNADVIAMFVYDSPGDTSAHTYRVLLKSNAGSASTEYPYNASGGQTRATIMAVEIAQ